MGIKYFWNSKGLPGTQKGGEKLILVFLSISRQFWVSRSALARPKQFQKYFMLLISVYNRG